MNKYLAISLCLLEKMAAEKGPLPYRKRVEVIIRKGDQILLTKNKNKDTGKPWYGFPGGGLDGDSAKEACSKECREEVGVDIINIKPLGVTSREEGGMSTKDDRHLKYRGSDTTFYVADYNKMDKSDLGEDGDSRQYVWEGPERALEALKEGGVRGRARVRAFLALKLV